MTRQPVLSGRRAYSSARHLGGRAYAHNYRSRLDYIVLAEILSEFIWRDHSSVFDKLREGVFRSSDPCSALCFCGAARFVWWGLITLTVVIVVGISFCAFSPFRSRFWGFEFLI
jgi:hypothetical protein